ncbi:MAG: hypothetical protein J0L53_13130 [Spirochaetes bacterium]|nr:hypothetical protein [Spirochaetota bacterium]
MAAVERPLTEEEIIALIGRLRSAAKNPLAGDDIARFKTGALSYAGSDSLIEQVHYKPGWLSPADIAYKLFARNWSDFLCKGIRPAHALLNLNLKRTSASAEFIRPFLRALDALLTKYAIVLVGGDTARSRTDSFTLTFIGHQGKFIPRRNPAVRAGDLVLQLGAVGGSEYARRMFTGKRAMPQRLLQPFRRPHLFERLPAETQLKAALDQSDSLAKTLRILAAENRAVIHVDLDRVELSHRDILRPRDILVAAEDLAVFGIAAKSSTAFRVIGHIESIREKRPGVVYRHRGKIVSTAAHDATGFTTIGFRHF